MAGNPIASSKVVIPGLKSLPQLRRLNIDLGSESQEDEVVLALRNLMFFNSISIYEDDGAQPAADGGQEASNGSHGGDGHGAADSKGAAADTEAAAAPQGRGAADAGAASERSEGSDAAAAASGDDGAAAADTGDDEGNDDDEDDDDFPIREVAMTEDDLEAVALVFGALKALRADVAGVDQDALTLAFDAHVEAVMQRLRERLEHEGDPFVRQAAILSAKHDLYDVVAAQVAEHAASGPASKQFAAVVRRLRAEQQQVVAELPMVVADATEHARRRLEKQRARTAGSEERAAELLKAASFLETHVNAARDEQEAMAQAFEQDRARLSERIRALEAENASLRVTARQFGGSEAVRKLSPSKGPSLRASALSDDDYARPDGSAPDAPKAAAGAMPPPPPTGYAARHAAARAADSSAASASAAPVFATAQRAAAASALDSSDAYEAGPGSSATSVATVPTSSGVAIKALTLKQLKATIEAIYASKKRFDAKCAKAKLPRETLEQHIYTYLNQQYGLRKLIVKHVAAIVKAVNRFSAVDNDVCVFGQILRNEVEEKFVQTQSSLKGTVKDLLRVFLKGKHPHKTDSVIDRLLRQRMSTVVFREEWQDMVRYMYKEEDADALCRILGEVIAADPQASSRLRHFKAMQKGADEVAAEGADLVGRAGAQRKADARQRKQAELHREAVDKGAVNYGSLLKTMLDFQLRGHQKYLEKFRRVFSHVDADGNGVVDEPEFRRLVKGIDSSKNDAQIDSLVALVDPFGHGHITFSDCVESLLGHP